MIDLGASERRKGFVYFLRAGDRVKIGFSLDVLERVAGLQASSPEPLELILVLPGAIADERRLHRLFRDDRLHNEWFRYSAEVRAYLAVVSDHLKIKDRPPRPKPPVRALSPPVDPIDGFIRSVCIVSGDLSHTATPAALYAAFQTWARQAGVYVLTAEAFAKRFARAAARGWATQTGDLAQFHKAKSRGMTLYRGLLIRPICGQGREGPPSPLAGSSLRFRA